MKRIILLFSFLTLIPIAIRTSLLAQSWDWVKASINHNPSSSGDPFGIAIDNSGNIYQVGTFYEGVTFGSFLLNSTADDTYLAKYDSNGNVLWIDTAANLAGNANDGYAIAIDKANNAYITGYFTDSVAFSTFHLYAKTTSEFFIAKYNSTGNLRWAKGGGAVGASTSIGFSVAADKQGNAYVAGEYTDTVTFDKDTLIANNGAQVFLVKYDTTGNVIWAKCSKASVWMYGGIGVSTDNTNHILVTGNFGNSITFGSNTLTSTHSGDADVFLVKYDSAGNVIWAKGSKESSHNGACTYAITNDGNSTYITGQFYDTVSFGANTLTCHNNAGDVFLAKYDSAGNVIWAKKGIVPRTNSALIHNTGFSVTSDKNHNVYLTGAFDDTISFDTLHLAETTMAPAFLVEFDSSGKALCGTHLANNNDDYSSVICNPSGTAVYFSGDVLNGYKAVFGNDTVLGIDGEVAFLARWQPCTNLNNEGVNELIAKGEELRVFPNPNNGVFKLGITNYELGMQNTIEIYNMLGRQVYSNYQITKSSIPIAIGNQIDLSSQPSGIYLYRVMNERGNLAGEGKFIIQR